MKPLARFGAIVGGYVLALLLAWATVALHVTVTDTLEHQASAGMASFGDAFLFLGVFGLAALAPTAVALWALRPYPRFWVVLGCIACAIAVSALVSVTAFVGWRADVAPPQWLSTLTMVAPLRMLFAPPLALLFAASAICAPLRAARIALGIATLIEGGAFLAFVVVLFRSAS